MPILLFMVTYIYRSIYNKTYIQLCYKLKNIRYWNADHFILNNIFFEFYRLIKIPYIQQKL